MEGIYGVIKISRSDAKKIIKEQGYTYLVGWSSPWDAWGEYWVKGDRCVFIHYNGRAGTDCSEIFKFSDPISLASYIYAAERGIIPFNKIAEAVKEVFGVDVSMSTTNKAIKQLFGEASK